MTRVKDGKTVARQNFSMHPDLLKAIMEGANVLSAQRSEAILGNRSYRVTFSKVVSALVFDALRRGLIRQEGERFVPTAKFAALIQEYEASFYEDVTVERRPKKPPSPPDAEQETFRHDCPAYGLSAEDYRRPFLWQGRRACAVGFDAANAQVPLLVEEEESGERFSLSLADFNASPWASDETTGATGEKEGETNDEEPIQE